MYPRKRVIGMGGGDGGGGCCEKGVKKNKGA